MTIHVTGSVAERRLIAAEAARYRSLADDLDAVLEGPPAWDRLVAAPLLLNWRMQARPAASLVGNVTGHPIIDPGPILTSSVILLASERGWARTVSRFYRLGEGAGR